MAMLGGTAAYPDPEPFSTSAPVIYTVTLAARVCPSYAQVVANRVRGNDQESLERLGGDSGYGVGQPVDPVAEAGAHAACKPLAGWRFTFGEDVTKTGLVSVVKRPNGSTGPTLATTPLLDRLGTPTGQPLAGAITVTLTEPQALLAQQHRLWVQGGRVNDPVGGYGFGTLRCAIDNANGNNVEWIGYPAGTRHVFCFAYYVEPRPAAGALVVRQEVTRKLGYPQRFGFTSTASYARDGVVELTTSGDPVSMTFYRSGGREYGVTARLAPGWRLVSLSCGSRKVGASTWTVADTTATVRLGGGDVVTCTFLAEPPPAAATGLTIRLATSGGLGGFGFTVQGPAGPVQQTATTTVEDTATVAGGGDTTALPPGAYTITQSGVDGWTLAGVACDGNAVPVSGLAATVTLVAGQPLDCVFHNRRRAGSITTRLVTLGGTAAAGFTVAAVTAPTAADGWATTAQTDQAGPPARATGGVPDRVPFGAYSVMSTPPTTTAAGSWAFREFTCDPGTHRAGGEATLTVELTDATPDAVCTAVYEFQPAVTLLLVVRAEGRPDGSGALVVPVSCADGASGQVVLPAPEAGPVTLPKPLSFPGPTSCTLAEATADGRPVAVRATVDDVPLTLPGTVQIGQKSVTVTVIALYGGAAGAAPPPDRQQLRLLPVAAIGVGLVGIGALVLLVIVARRAVR
jgi:hypothetical protein